MSHDPEGFLSQFDKAREEMKRAKTRSPYLFPQYLRLRRAKDALEAAQKEYDEAEAAWNRVGST